VIVVCLFYYPMIVRWLTVLMVEADYPLVVGSLQGTQTYAPDISISFSCESQGFGPLQLSEVNPSRPTR
jgi:hypothetical protein